MLMKDITAIKIEGNWIIKIDADTLHDLNDLIRWNPITAIPEKDENVGIFFRC